MNDDDAYVAARVARDAAYAAARAAHIADIDAANVVNVRAVRAAISTYRATIATIAGAHKEAGTLGDDDIFLLTPLPRKRATVTIRQRR